VKFFEIIRPGTQIDFISYWRRWMLVSVLVIAAGGVWAAVFGIRVGVDFAGGTEAHIRFAKPSDEGAVRGALGGADLPGLSVVRFGEATDYLVRFQGDRKIGKGPSDEAPTAKNDRVIAMEESLRARLGDLTLERVEFVGPKVGAELRNAGLEALAISALLIVAYVWFRFSGAFAPGALVALVHDVLVTSAVLVMLGREFDLEVLAAQLALAGYSLNDTIIVYDRIRETLGIRGGENLAATMNEAVNQTLSRTLITSGLTMLSVLALLFIGGPVVRNFSLTMAIGIVAGTYSSIYIASPIALVIEERQKRSLKTPAAKPTPAANKAAAPAAKRPGKR
jgi:preprotein translocase subunit SecF